MTGQHEAKVIVESLRSGVASRQVASRLPLGREGLLADFQSKLKGLSQVGPRAMFIRADYGQGKTHLLHALWDLALRENCVVSLVTLSKETPFDKLNKIYPKVVAGTYVPGSSQPGIEQLVSNISSRSLEADKLLHFADDNLHPRISVVLKNYIEGQNDDSLYTLLQDLSGDFLPGPTLKAIHRLNFQSSARPGSFAPTRQAWDYFRMLDLLVQVKGYRGWVLLFDEAELIGKLGLGGRAKAYANTERFLSRQGGLSATVSVFSFAASFYSEVIERRDEEFKAPAWHTRRGHSPEAEAAGRALEAIQQAESLPVLNRDQLAAIMQQIVEVHSTAYQWQSPLQGHELLERVVTVRPEADTRLRTRIRMAIHWLDHIFQYGEEPHLILSELREERLEEEAAAALDSSADEDETPRATCAVLP
jgi:hypothetical protein